MNITLEASSPQAIEVLKEFSKNRNALAKVHFLENKLIIRPRGVMRLLMKGGVPETVIKSIRAQVDEEIEKKGLKPEDVILRVE